MPGAGSLTAGVAGPAERALAERALAEQASGRRWVALGRLGSAGLLEECVAGCRSARGCSKGEHRPLRVFWEPEASAALASLGGGCSAGSAWDQQGDSAGWEASNAHEGGALSRNGSREEEGGRGRKREGEVGRGREREYCGIQWAFRGPFLSQSLRTTPYPGRSWRCH